MDLPSGIGRNIAKYREAERLTQEQLAEEVGTLLGRTFKRQAVWSAERGRRAFPAVELVAFAYVLKVPVIELLRPPETALQDYTLPDGTLVNFIDDIEMIGEEASTPDNFQLYETLEAIQRSLSTAMSRVDDFKSWIKRMEQ